MSAESLSSKKVVIVGAGFAGLQLAKGLSQTNLFDTKLLDRRNYHLFQPLLYQVAMAGLSPAEIAVPIRSQLSDSRVAVLLANVQSIDVQHRLVLSDAGTFNYDYLILACGAKHSYFGKSDWEPMAPGLKTLEQATEIRRRMLMAFEVAEREPDIDKRKAYLTFIVVGGGPTGVELAGAIGEISRYTLAKDFRHIRSDSARIILIEAGDRILSSFSPRLSRSATRVLEKLGVQVWTQSRVTAVNENGVRLNEEVVLAKTVLWAAGVQASSLNKSLPGTLDQQGRIFVGPDLALPDHPEIFVLGDQAHVVGRDGAPLPGLAPVAIQQGCFMVKQLISIERQNMRLAFRYNDKGQMATIGRKAAVMQMGKLEASGLIAWIAWLLIHIYYLIGFKNRLFVFLQWAWHYINYGRGARLILHKEWRSYQNS